MNTRAKRLSLYHRLKMWIFGTPFADPPLQIAAPKDYHYNHEKALRDMLHKGISIGVKQSAIVYSCFCERHNTRLHEVMPGVFVCMLCQTGPMQTVQQTTEPLQKRPLLAYLEEHRLNPGVDTAEFRTVHLGQRARQS